MALTKPNVTKDLNPTPPPVDDGLDFQEAVEQVFKAPKSEIVAVDVQPQEVSLRAPQAEGDAFDELDDCINFTSFPTVKLKAGQIIFDGQPFLGELLIKCEAVSSQWIVKASNIPGEKRFFYSGDDGAHNMEGISGEVIKGGWLAEGCDPKGIHKKKYLWLQGIVVKDGQQRMVAVSIPPASQGRLAGYNAEMRALNGGLSKVWTKLFPGSVKEITKEGTKINFVPWDFAYVKNV